MDRGQWSELERAKSLTDHKTSSLSFYDSQNLLHINILTALICRLIIKINNMTKARETNKP